MMSSVSSDPQSLVIVVQSQGKATNGCVKFGD